MTRQNRDFSDIILQNSCIHLKKIGEKSIKQINLAQFTRGLKNRICFSAFQRKILLYIYSCIVYFTVKNNHIFNQDFYLF